MFVKCNRLGAFALRFNHRERNGQTVPLISREHLLRNKRAAGRHKDLDDVENLEEMDEN